MKAIHLNYYVEMVERASLEMVQREIRATEQSRAQGISGAKLDILSMFMEAAKEASELLDASPAASGRYLVI